VETYCIYCKNGSEQKIIHLINENSLEITALVPTRVVSEKVRGKWTQKEKSLLPGYIFLYAESEEELLRSPRLKDMYKVLEYDSGIRTLTGPDYDYAMWLYNYHGKIAASEVFQDGDEIRIMSGPLLSFKGKIIKIEKRKKRALVEFEFEGNKQKISVGVEFMAKKPDS